MLIATSFFLASLEKILLNIVKFYITYPRQVLVVKFCEGEKMISFLSLPIFGLWTIV